MAVKWGSVISLSSMVTLESQRDKELFWIFQLDGLMSTEENALFFRAKIEAKNPANSFVK